MNLYDFVWLVIRKLIPTLSAFGNCFYLIVIFIVETLLDYLLCDKNNPDPRCRRGITRTQYTPIFYRWYPCVLSSQANGFLFVSNEFP